MSFGGNFVAVPICGVVKYNYIHAHDCHDGYMYVRSTRFVRVVAWTFRSLNS